jgi:hypothetical protein
MVPMHRAQRPGSRSESVGALVMQLLDHMRTGADPSLQTRYSLPEAKVFVLPGIRFVDFIVAIAAASLGTI